MRMSGTNLSHTLISIIRRMLRGPPGVLCVRGAMWPPEEYLLFIFEVSLTDQTLSGTPIFFTLERNTYTFFFYKCAADSVNITMMCLWGENICFCIVVFFASHAFKFLLPSSVCLKQF